MIYCNDKTCQYYDNQQCQAGKVYHVDRQCKTYRRKMYEESYTELMKPEVGICWRKNRRMQRSECLVIK